MSRWLHVAVTLSALASLALISVSVSYMAFRGLPSAVSPVRVVDAWTAADGFVPGQAVDISFDLVRERSCPADIWQFWKRPDGSVLWRPDRPIVGGYTEPGRGTVTVRVIPPEVAAIRAAPVACYAPRIDSHCGDGDTFLHAPPVCAPVAPPADP